jgi:hypothetical protein
MNFGIVESVTASPIDSAREEVDIDVDTPDAHEPLQTDEDTKEYFNSVTEGEALNYLMMLHDIRAISFDRLNQLKVLLEDSPSFLPKGY